ncbi:MAG: C4-dicarboxylate ABC transporter, partial [Gemmataceae bacterium]|nr:C4-dicarboxylate ABC transporter [Gemmataceae bacterium]
MGKANLPPSIFALVMATGIVSIAAGLAGMATLGLGLFIANLFFYGALWLFLLARLRVQPAAVWADLQSHSLAPGFFTLVAATCLLGSQFILFEISPLAGLVFWCAGLAFWFVLTYTVLPLLMQQEEKPSLEKGLNGGWLVTVVATQSVSVLGSLVAEQFGGLSPFIPLCFWLLGGMLYVWLISLIFYRILFLPLAPGDLTPPYWINMGAMAISTLAGIRLTFLADRSPLVAELLPFIKGATLLFWATATWWIPVLLALGGWRHLKKKVPLGYDHGYWSAVFPIGMYSVATRGVSEVMGLPFLLPL